MTLERGHESVKCIYKIFLDPSSGKEHCYEVAVSKCFLCFLYISFVFMFIYH